MAETVGLRDKINIQIFSELSTLIDLRNALNLFNVPRVWTRF